MNTKIFCDSADHKINDKALEKTFLNFKNVFEVFDISSYYSGLFGISRTKFSLYIKIK